MTTSPPRMRSNLPSVRLRLASVARSGWAVDLAGILDVPRIDRLLDRAHEVEPSPMLDAEILHLALADAVLAGAGAVHADGPKIEPSDEFAGTLDLAGILHVDHDRQMEIAVADMTEDRRNQPGPRDILHGLADAIGQARDRHADVGRDVLGAGPEGEGGEVAVMPRLPEPAALLRPRRPREDTAPELARDR